MHLQLTLSPTASPHVYLKPTSCLTYQGQGCITSAISFFISLTMGPATCLRPGKGMGHFAREAKTRRTWCCISSCSFGTLANLARLPISDVVVRSSVKFGENEMSNSGTGEVGEGGVIVNEDLKIERDIVRNTGRRANEGMG